MFVRHKVLLRIFRQSGRAVSRMELTKWCFLLRHEFPSAGGSSFFDFVPYRYGPFSFALYHEMATLERNGLVMTPSEKHWGLSADADLDSTLPRAVSRDIDELLRQFQRYKPDALRDYVYKRHPFYTVNSEVENLAPRPVAKVAVYTSGYEGLSVDAFLTRLIRCGITRVIDVRCNPVARRYGFHKSTLSRLLGRVDIDYVHLPQLGIPSALRRSLECPDDYHELFQRYENTTLRSEHASIDHVAKLISEQPSVLICMEADPAFCHRTRLAQRVAKLTGLDIIDLGTDE